MEKEQILTSIQSILPDLKQAIETGVAYGGELFNRIITFVIIQKTVDIVISSILFAVSTIIVYKIFKYLTNKKKEDEYFDLTDLSAPMFFGVIVVLIIGGLFIVMYPFVMYELIVDIAKIKIVPELYIVEYIKGF